MIPETIAAAICAFGLATLAAWRIGARIARHRNRPEAQPATIRVELYAHAATARIDQALAAWAVDKTMPPSALVDALLDVRHRLGQGLVDVESS